MQICKPHISISVSSLLEPMNECTRCYVGLQWTESHLSQRSYRPASIPNYCQRLIIHIKNLTQLYQIYIYIYF